MRKLFTILIAVIFMAVSCQHEEIWDKLNDHEQRIEQLEQQCKELNDNVVAVQAILTALQDNDHVTEVMKIMENGVEVGYSLTFAKAGTVTLYHGIDGADAAAPKIGVKKANDGAYYWTAGDEWITSDDGSMIPATVASDGDYVTPQFRVAEDRWYVSFDNGNSWRPVELINEEVTQFFRDVRYDDRYVYITLADGSLLDIPYGSAAGVDEMLYASAYGVKPGEVDAQKLNELLSEASSKNKTIRFNDGEYCFSETVAVPSDVSLVGSTKTVFKRSSEMTSGTLMTVKLQLRTFS